MENMSLKIRRFLPKFSLRDLICRHSVSDSFLISTHHRHYQSHDEAEVPSRHKVDLTKKAKSCHVMLIFGSNHWIVATHQRSSLSLLHQMSIAIIIIFSVDSDQSSNSIQHHFEEHQSRKGNL